MVFGQAFRTGIRRRWKSGIERALGVVGFAWPTVAIPMETIPAVKAWVGDYGIVPLGAATLIGLIVFTLHIREPHSVSFPLKPTPTQLTIRFGNLFDETGNLLVSVNEFFDSQLGDVVAPTTVHGQVLTRLYSSNEALFRGAVDPLLP